MASFVFPYPIIPGNPKLITDAIRPSAAIADTVICCTNRSKLPFPDAFNFCAPSSALKDARADIGVESAEYDISNAPDPCETINSLTRSIITN
eukprot:6476246-Amphidinium_carterae.8